MKTRTKLTIILAAALMILPVLAGPARSEMIKLDPAGRELADDAPEWAMVRDTDTGLT